ncbi:membrane protein insertion efficiency factor YidD [Georgenia sp. Z1344]|uniref:membrane protein insertion efficiency factor YidD n=1 Tax=Georgenia sp. Z1344 TaxID=3416706 RepID=UPI003CF9A796
MPEEGPGRERSPGGGAQRRADDDRRRVVGGDQHAEGDDRGGSRLERGRVGPITWLLLKAVRGYQLIVSPWFPPTCRYYPSCSAFAVGALRTHGAGKGLLLAVWRVLRCNPWSRGGVDHVPERGAWVGRRVPLPDPDEPGEQPHQAGTGGPGHPTTPGPPGASTLGGTDRGACDGTPQDL